MISSHYCSGNSRASIDPVLFFHMQIIDYLYGVKFDRKLCEEVYLNLAYRWLCRLNHEDSRIITDRHATTGSKQEGTIMFDRIM
ncbi:transposase [Dasania sp. GY-MA-18]|uniref:transposase n=1 Tax=Dasania sp. GY-MA-18 TaxID=2966584 RepID=UPI0035CD2231